jgi:endo-1,4-beta-xylanase
LLERQAEYYGKLFQLLREYKDIVTGVTFWGASDEVSWLNGFLVKRKNWPLLFDSNQQPKKAFWNITDLSVK